MTLDIRSYETNIEAKTKEEETLLNRLAFDLNILIKLPTQHLQVVEHRSC